MRSRLPVIWAGPALMLAALAGAALMRPARASEGSSMRHSDREAVPASAWAGLAGKRIFFGHQSVGGNILQGVTDLAGRDGVPPLTVAELGAARPGPGLVHAQVGRNGAPESKMDHFLQLLDASADAPPDVAFMKLCYVDISESTDVEALFAHYRGMADAVRARHPGVTLVHVTTPLQGPPAGLRQSLRQFVKGLTGRGGTGPARNARREQYNDLMRRAYGGREPLFDLAAVESERPGGRRATMKHDGRAVPRLAGEYTYDGGHLNAEGRRHVAGRLLAFLAGLPERP